MTWRELSAVGAIAEVDNIACCCRELSCMESIAEGWASCIEYLLSPSMRETGFLSHPPGGLPESYNAKNLAQGAPYEMRDANGNRLELHRDGQRNLQEIRTPHGHWIRFAYDELSRIKRAEDDGGHWAQYDYNSDGMLNAVTLSSGRRRNYDYDGVLMTQITDETGHVLLKHIYKSRLLRQQQFGSGEIYSYRYDWAPTAYYPDKVVVTLPNQMTRELSVGGCS